MLDTETDRKGLGLDEHTPPLQHAERIARAVSGRQHHVMRMNRLAAREHYPGDAAVLKQQIFHPTLESNLTTESYDLLAHCRDHAREAKGTDVWLADVHNLRRRSGAHKLVHHLAAIELGVLDLAVELAVGKQPRPAFAELHVRFRGQYSSAPQGPGVRGTPPYLRAALEHNRFESHLGE